MKVMLLSVNGVIPIRATKSSTGFDLFSAEDKLVKANDKNIIFTDICIEVPEGCYGRIAPRSGLAVKFHLDIGAGVIDRDYRGNVGVVIFNHSSQDYQVKKHDRIAQLILEKIETPSIEIVDKFDQETERNDNGFGSTGL